MWTLDTETRTDENGEQQLVIVSVYDGVRSRSFFSAGDFKNFMLSSMSGDVWIHNTAFDVPVLFFRPEFSDLKLENLFTVRSSILFSVKTDIGQVNIRDSALLFPMRLEKLAEAAGRTQKEKFDISAWQRAGCPVTDELVRYNILDCVSLFESLEVMFAELKDLGIEDIKKTMASTAFNFVESRQSGRGLIREKSGHLPALIDLAVRKAYYGGRCEPFFIGELPDVRHVDKRSMYPSCLASELYPVFPDNPNRWKAVSGKRFPRARWKKDKHVGVFDVVVHVSEDHPLPPIP